MRRPGLAFALASMVTTAAAPADVIVYQKGRTFSLATLSLTPGQQVIFINDDTVAHNVMSTARENTFDLGLQMPNTAIPVSFTGTGIVPVDCGFIPECK